MGVMFICFFMVMGLNLLFSEFIVFRVLVVNMDCVFDRFMRLDVFGVLNFLLCLEIIEFFDFVGLFVLGFGGVMYKVVVFGIVVFIMLDCRYVVMVVLLEEWNVGIL